MHDTSPVIEEHLYELYAQRTPEERVMMCSQMFDTAVTLVKAGILHQHPDISATELRWEVFLRFYADCYTEEELQRIRAYLCPS